MWSYHSELLAKPVPRYTSYPTAVEFHDGCGADEYIQALSDMPSGTPLSLYVHIPYCHSICWYCGCNTGAAGKAQRLTAYLDALESEFALIGRLLGGRGKVRRIAFGGGSPNAITTIEFVRLLDRITTIFDAGTPEISVELDPRGFTSEWALALAASNVGRVSLGVQTFAPHVQEAIGRIQPLADIEKSVFDQFRSDVWPAQTVFAGSQRNADSGNRTATQPRLVIRLCPHARDDTAAEAD